MSKLKLLDLFCGGGGASYGYELAGFDVTGIDLYQGNYKGKFIEYNIIDLPIKYLKDYDVIHASPPCQKFSKTKVLNNNSHPDLVLITRELLQKSKKPYIIENVVGCPLINPILLCGTMFNLATYRHRIFESNLDLKSPTHPDHIWKQTKMGRKPVDGEFIQFVGNFIGADKVRKMLGMEWLSIKELAQCIPPQYTEYLGKQIYKLVSF